MDTTQWHQELGLAKPMENNNNNSNSSTSNLITGARRERPQREQALNCPRCKSTNTKFCYYNNYSLTQPRYFCKTCRRYWTEGGSLRNVPIGGGSRKNKKNTILPSSSNLNSSNSKSAPMITTIPSTFTVIEQNPNQDLNLAFTVTNSTTNSSNILNLLDCSSTMMINPFIPTHSMPIGQSYDSEFGLHKIRTNTSFAFDGISGNVGTTSSNASMSFAFEETRKMRNDSISNDHEDNQFEQKSFWTGMMGGGSW